MNKLSYIPVALNQGNDDWRRSAIEANVNMEDNWGELVVHPLADDIMDVMGSKPMLSIEIPNIGAQPNGFGGGKQWSRI